MRRAMLLGTLALCAGLPGCVMFEVGVTNPVAGLTTVAVAPFFNLSEEPTVDGRRFAQAYFAELQKTPGFQVVPVGVVEQAIHDHRLEMTGPDDALKLAEILKVDAVVVGAVTDYSPYYPPRIGLQIAWYSPYDWAFVPGVPIEDNIREMVAPPSRFGWRKSKCPPGTETCPPQTLTPRAQSPDDDPQANASWWARTGAWRPFSHESAETGVTLVNYAVTDSVQTTDVSPVPPTAFNPRLPLMSYTRMFDGADPQLTARLRDYFELSGDLRSGGWEAYLGRSEDFIRFTSHVMIVEMLQLHGGEAKRRVVVKWRKHR
ncbi:MAG TPA: hypothetical protein VM165_15060 [Planctomycetaceae bacterium]|nr:hypothetical protein [Planctomycetaceae bacterium]